MVLAPSAILIPGTGARTPSHPGCGCHPKPLVPITSSILAWLGIPCPLMDIVAWMCQHTPMQNPSLVPSLDWENATSFL